MSLTFNDILLYDIFREIARESFGFLRKKCFYDPNARKERINASIVECFCEISPFFTKALTFFSNYAIIVLYMNRKDIKMNYRINWENSDGVFAVPDNVIDSLKLANGKAVKVLLYILKNKMISVEKN